MSVLWRSRSDLPLASDATSRFLPWLVALMVFLSALALAALFVIGHVVERWNRDISGTLTVQVAPVLGENSIAGTQQRVDKALDLLRATPGVLSARALSAPELVALVEPWLGNSELVKDLPLPRLLDVAVDPSYRLDIDGLAERLARDVDGASLDDHRIWLSRLVSLSQTIELLAVVSVLLIAGVTVLTVIYATRSGMAVHGEVIEVLHLTGAQDDYVAGQFADRTFRQGLLGGALGALMAVPALIAIAAITRRMEGGFVPHLALPAVGWIAVLLLPLVVALLMMATARLTVLRTLAKLP